MYIDFWIFHLAKCIWDSSTLLHESVVLSCLPLGSILVCGHATICLPYQLLENVWVVSSLGQL